VVWNFLAWETDFSEFLCHPFELNAIHKDCFVCLSVKLVTGILLRTYCDNINWRDVQRKNVANTVDRSTLRSPIQNGPYKTNTENNMKHTEQQYVTDIQNKLFFYSSIYILYLLKRFVSEKSICFQVRITGLYSDANDIEVNFNRPVKSVAIDPKFSNQRFVAGDDKLILHQKGYFGNKQTVLHQGEGPIRTIKWMGDLIAWSNNVVCRELWNHFFSLDI